ncbi:MAG: SCO3242 family prenyltransferase [Pseudonocardiaceae bacterium]
MSRRAALARLVRAPAALTALGDTLAGAAAAGRPLRGRRLALPVASVALYWAGMALNDYADRAVDAHERPERPIPSGQVSPGQALAVAGGLTVGGLALAAAGGGRDALRVAGPLAAMIWAYDCRLKHTPAGPVAMAACRGLDVLLGAGWRARRRALPAAGVLAVHTLGVTTLSRGEVHGGSAAGGTVAAACSAVAGVAALLGPARSRRHRAAAALAAAAFTALVVPLQLVAAQQPTAAAVRAATVAGIHGMVVLQCALTARRGPLLGAALVAAAFPLARRLGRRVSPT